MALHATLLLRNIGNVRALRRQLRLLSHKLQLLLVQDLVVQLSQAVCVYSSLVASICHVHDGVTIEVTCHTLVLDVLLQAEGLLRNKIILPVRVKVRVVRCSWDLVSGLHRRWETAVQICRIGVADLGQTERVVSQPSAEGRNRSPVCGNVAFVKLFLVFFLDFLRNGYCLRHRFDVSKQELRSEPLLTREDPFDPQGVEELSLVDLVSFFFVLLHFVDVFLVVVFFLFLNVAFLV